MNGSCFSFPMAMQTQPGYSVRDDQTYGNDLIVEVIVLILNSFTTLKANIRAGLVEWVNS